MPRASFVADWWNQCLPNSSTESNLNTIVFGDISTSEGRTQHWTRSSAGLLSERGLVRSIDAERCPQTIRLALLSDTSTIRG